MGSLKLFSKKYNLILFRLALTAAIQLLFFTANSQSIPPPPAPNKKLKIEAVKATQKILIDGKLLEKDWSNCIAAANFIQAYPNQGKAASYTTEVKILYDNENIYIGAICKNPGNKIYVQDLRRDFLYGNNELFGVFLDPFQDVQNPIPSFLVTPYSSQRDLLIYDDRIFDLKWDAVWSSKSAITDSSWSTEIAIPWSTLRYPSDSTTWGINFNRNIRSLNEITGWSPWPMAYTVGRMSYAGLVTNLHPPKNKANIRLQPYTLLNSTKNTRGQTNTKPQIGGEVKWLINTNTSLEGTYNTDFAQADADRQVVNLNRSSVYFPEKRQFFLENANLFSVGQDGILQPFFSRRIGLDENGNPLKINGGLRFIHQSAKRAFGAMFMQQADKDTSTKSYFGVIRGQQNIGVNNRIGTLITFQHDQKTNLSNTNVSIDGYWRNVQSLYMRPMFSTSLGNNATKKGWAFFNELGYIKNNFSFLWYQTIVSRNYNPSMGFIARNNFINTQPQFTLNLRKHWLHDKITYFSPSVKANIYHTASNGKLEEASFTLIPFKVTFKNGEVFAFYFGQSSQYLNYVYQPIRNISVIPGKYQYKRNGFYFNTNLSAPWSIISEANWGGFYDGKLNSYFFSGRYVPIPNISIAIDFTYNYFLRLGLTKESVKTYLIAPELRFSLNPKVQLTGFYQYNTVSNTGGLNMRFAWEYKPLSFVYIVFNNLKTIDTKLTQNAINDNTGILKISYIKQL